MTGSRLVPGLCRPRLGGQPDLRSSKPAAPRGIHLVVQLAIVREAGVGDLHDQDNVGRAAVPDDPGASLGQ
jgi:hypothetical protein